MPTCPSQPQVDTSLVLSFIPLTPLANHLPLPPPRPNTDPRSNYPLDDSSHLPYIRSTLNKEAWSYYLRDYPNRTFVSTLVQIIHHGASLGFSGDRSKPQFCTNLKSALENPQTIAALSEDIAVQTASGRTHGPFPSPPFPNFHASPLGAVTRKRSSKIRRIHHLSWPEGDSVNDGIPDSEAAIVYDMVDRTITDLVASGPGSLMLKLDLESAFRHIPVRVEDWPLLGFTWLGQLYYDIVLGFGCRSAPYVFNLFSEALHWILERNIPARIRHYLDDFLGIFPPSSSSKFVDDALHWAIELGSQLGLTFQPSKVVGPGTTIEFLGLELDSIAMEIRLPREKLDHLRNLTSSWVHRRTCTHREIDELTGFLQFTSQVIPTSRAFLRGLYDFAATFHGSSQFTRKHISKSALYDICWWHSVAAYWNGIHLISPSRRNVNFFTDASGKKGLGGHFETRWFAARCPRRLRGEHIQVKEMFAVLYAVLCWGDLIRGCHITFHVDNEAVFSAIRDTTIRSPSMMKLVRHLIALSCRLDFSFSSAWLSSSANSVADAASRFAFTRMFQIAPQLNKKPSSKTLQLGGTNITGSTPKPLRSISGMASHPAPGKLTHQASGNSSTMSSSMVSTTPTAPSSLPHNPQSFPGLPASEDGCNQRQSRHTSLQCALSMSMLTCHSTPQSLPLSNDSSVASSGTMGNVTASLCNQLPSQCSPPYSPNSDLGQRLATQQYTPHAALLTRASSAAVSSPQERAPSSTQASI